MGASYVDAVEAAIKQLEDNINNHQYRNLGISQLQGYMLEEWGSGTFNIDAVAADSADRASVLHSTLKDSVDIQLDSGKAYSASPRASACACPVAVSSSCEVFWSIFTDCKSAGSIKP